MQIMPETWSDMTKNDVINYPFDSAFNPEKNVEIGTKYYYWVENWLSTRVPDWNSKERIDQYKLMAAAYNGGIGKLKNVSWDINLMPYETRDYVRKIKEYLSI